jgi:hypothetical protein
VLQDSPILLCGFCGHRSKCWKDRLKHVGDHFQNRTDLTQWWLKRADNCSTTIFVSSELSNEDPAHNSSGIACNDKPPSENLSLSKAQSEESPAQIVRLTCNLCRSR